MKYEILKNSFLGPKLDKSKSYTIIGGGIAGLLTAFRLKKEGIPFKLLEKTNRCGGLLATSQHYYGISEHAANGFIWCKELQEICDTIKLPILKPKASAKARFLVRNKKLYQMPLKPWEILGVLSKVFIPRKNNCETLADFGLKYFGASFNQQILEPAMAGIYGANINKLSLPGAIPFLAEALNTTSFLPKGVYKIRMNSTTNPKGNAKKIKGTCGFELGMGSFIQHLENYLKEDIEYEVDGLSLKDSKENLLITIPAYASKAFFTDPLYGLLNDVKYTAMISATLVFSRKHLKNFKDGFGCLIPRKEGLNLLGVLFNSSIFDHRVKEEDLVSLTCMLRDESPERSLINRLDVDLKNLIVKELNDLFDVDGNPLEYAIYRWPQGIPLYSPSLYKSWFSMDEILKKEFPNRNLFGNYTGKISIRGMSQHIFQTTID